MSPVPSARRAVPGIGAWGAVLAACTLLLSGCGPAPGPKAPLTAHQIQGKAVYQASCVRCHGVDGENPTNGPRLGGLSHWKYLTSGAPATDERLRATIFYGRGLMPGFAGTIDQASTDALLDYLRTL